MPQFCGIFIYSINDNANNVANKVGIPITIPYFTKFLNEKLTSYVFNKLIHIIPAKAPTGVIKAAILDAIMLA